MAERNYWFAPRWLGIGFSPASWQGWLCLLAYLVLLGWTLGYASAQVELAPGAVAALALVETAVLFAIILAKRDKSRVVRWRWFGGR